MLQLAEEGKQSSWQRAVLGARGEAGSKHGTASKTALSERVGRRIESSAGAELSEVEEIGKEAPEL